MGVALDHPLEQRAVAVLAGGQRLRRRVALADVLNHGDEVPGLARLGAHQVDRQVDPDDGAVLAEVPLLHRVGGDLAGHQLADVLQVRVQVVGVGDVLESARQQFLRRIADDVAQPLVDAQPAAVEPHLRHPDRGLLEQRPEGLLALLQGMLRGGDLHGHEVEVGHQRPEFVITVLGHGGVQVALRHAVGRQRQLLDGRQEARAQPPGLDHRHRHQECYQHQPEANQRQQVRIGLNRVLFGHDAPARHRHFAHARHHEHAAVVASDSDSPRARGGRPHRPGADDLAEGAARLVPHVMERQAGLVHEHDLAGAADVAPLLDGGVDPVGEGDVVDDSSHGRAGAALGQRQGLDDGDDRQAGRMVPVGGR